jgi:hypothetical protein
MFRKIIIHAGLHKTGTSYIQNCLDALSRNGQLIHTSYPILNDNSEFAGIQSGNGEAIAFQLLEEMVPDFSEEAVNGLTETLINESDSGRSTLLISSEHFCNASPQRFKYFLHVLSGYSTKIEIVVFTRPLLGLCQSSYHQQVKRHSLSIPYGSMFYSQFCQELVRRVGVIGLLSEQAYVHSLNYKDRNLLSELLVLLGEDIALESQFNNQIVNRSLTAKELNLLRTINSVFKSDILSTRISDRWIYAQPAATSHSEHASLDDLMRIFNETISEHKSKLDFDACRVMIDNLLQEDVSLSAANDKKDSEPAQEYNEGEAPSVDSLLLMALEEVSKFTHLERSLVQQTRNFKPTKDVFDPVHYLLLNRDVLAAGVDPVKHFKSFGFKEDRFTGYSYVSSLVS